MFVRHRLKYCIVSAPLRPGSLAIKINTKEIAVGERYNNNISRYKNIDLIRYMGFIR